MGFLLALSLPLLIAAIVSSWCTVAWRNTLASRSWFFVSAFIIVLGTHRVLEVVVNLFKLLWMPSGSYILEYQGNSDFVELASKAIAVESTVLAAVAALAGYFILQRLRKGISR
jgi:hypothetical protein